MNTALQSRSTNECDRNVDSEEEQKTKLCYENALQTMQVIIHILSIVI